MAVFKAIEVDRKPGASFYQINLVERDTESLPAGDLLIRVRYSSLNFKDALSCKGNRGVTRSYPHTPGIDAAGEVEESSHPDYKPGDQVIVTGYDLGMNTPGGFAQYIRVPAAWVVPLPASLSLKDSMVLGTAGLTAALCVNKIQRMGVTPRSGEILVTGATGGVGSLAVAILHKLGYTVAGCTGKLERARYLIELGATKVVDRDTLMEGSDRALLPEQWAGAIDTVGGDILFNLLKSVSHSGSVACCGLVSSPNFEANVYPFILRGVNLLGVDSVEISAREKASIWHQLAMPWRLDHLENVTTEIGLRDIDDYVERIMKGRLVGRILINVERKD